MWLEFSRREFYAKYSISLILSANDHKRNPPWVSGKRSQPARTGLSAFWAEDCEHSTKPLVLTHPASPAPQPSSASAPDAAPASAV
jgi:hypothetical protein